MTVSSARVQDFQSIADASVEFGSFTVLVGPSSSGKSAFLRAVRACIRNDFVPSMVRSGKSKSVVTLDFVGGDSVSIERGKSLSTYSLGNDKGTFTKSARSVPLEIEKILAMPMIEGVDASMRFQFDKPFLLADPGSRASQVLGSLTNASLLHSAVREANRRASESLATLKVRKDDVDRLSGLLEDYADLEDKRSQVEKAEKILGEAREVAVRRDRIVAKMEELRGIQKSLKSLEVSQPPDPTKVLNHIQELTDRLASLTQAFGRVQMIKSQLTQEQDRSHQLKSSAEELESQYVAYLKSLGQCPTCGQSTDHD